MGGRAADDMVLVLQQADEPGQVEFVVTRTVADELLTLLSEHGLAARVADRHVRSGGDGLLSTIAVVASSSAAWTAIGVCVKAFLDRHKSKRIRVDQQGLIDASGYSANDIERIARTLAQRNNGQSGSVESTSVDGDVQNR